MSRLQTRIFPHYTKCDYNCALPNLNKLPIYSFTVLFMTNVASLEKKIIKDMNKFDFEEHRTKYFLSHFVVCSSHYMLYFARIKSKHSHYFLSF